MKKHSHPEYVTKEVVHNFIGYTFVILVLVAIQIFGWTFIGDSYDEACPITDTFYSNWTYSSGSHECPTEFVAASYVIGVISLTLMLLFLVGFLMVKFSNWWDY